MDSSTEFDKSAYCIRIVDDEDFRTSLAFMLEAEGWSVRTWPEAASFLRDDAPSLPGCLLLDVRMPGMSGIDLQREMKARGYRLPVIILTGHGTIDTAVEVLKLGALDFLQKPVDPGKLVAAVKAACLDSVIRLQGFRSAEEAREAFAGLTEQEMRVIALLARGLASARDIGARMGVSERTVHGHRLGIYRRLRVHSETELVQLIGAVYPQGLPF